MIETKKNDRILVSIMKWHPSELRHISLKWKLLIPFLFLPTALTIFLVGWEIRTQNNMLAQQEESRMQDNFLHLKQRLQLRLDSSGAMARLVAANPLVQKALAEKDRQTLIDLYQNVCAELTQQVGIKQFHFHIFPGYSFLRLHSPERHSDELSSYRQTISRAYKTGQVVSGLEYGATGFGLRGVAPIYYQGELVGSVEIGWSLELPFLQRYMQDFDSHITLYTPDPAAPEDFRVLATTSESLTFLASSIYKQVMGGGEPGFKTMQINDRNLAVLVGPVKDFQGRTVAVIELVRDRSGTLDLIRKHATLIISFALAILILALVFVWWISALFLAPIWVLVDQAEKITSGERVPHMDITVRDEFGVLAESLNRMLTSLEDSRYRLQNQAQELEVRVRERTAELVQSEEKFRTLVENIPIAVYRLESGMIRSFVSSHIERLTGWPPEELVGGLVVWSSVIHPQDRRRVMEEKRRSLEAGEVFDMEYRLVDKQGQEVPILDHAEPVGGENGRTRYMEGYMLDLRDRKRLEEQSNKAEELKTLSEISTRLAHEFRNPLSVVGLSARRLSRIIEGTQAGAPYVKIIIEEVARLEQILRMILSFIQPLEVHPHPVSTALFIKDVTRSAHPILEEKGIELSLLLEEDLPDVNLDSERLSHCILNLIRNAAYQVPSHGVIQLIVTSEGRDVFIKFVYPAGYLPDDQLRHYFYPFTTEEADTSLVDLPLVPVCVHKHDGVIDVDREGDDLIAVTIVLPAAQRS
jgi:PAS domain S-box-containing protein